MNFRFLSFRRCKFKLVTLSAYSPLTTLIWSDTFKYDFPRLPLSLLKTALLPSKTFVINSLTSLCEGLPFHPRLNLQCFFLRLEQADLHKPVVSSYNSVVNLYIFFNIYSFWFADLFTRLSIIWPQFFIVNRCQFIASQFFLL